MNLFHFSDTHLGFSEYNRIDPNTGLNQREQDFYIAWQQVIEAILKTRPDAVVHAGDLFHTSRPNNRAIRVALEGIQQISDSDIPLVLISGNHSTPRIRATGSIFESIALFPNVFAAYEGKYQRFRIKGTDFHCIPHCSLTEELQRVIADINILPDADCNVLLTHGAWSGKKYYGMGEFNEQRLPDVEGELGVQFDYIALGHYHRRVDVKTHACYSGATERTSLNEHNSTCGYLQVDLSTLEKKYLEIQTRPMVKLPLVDCTDLTVQEIYAELQNLNSDKLNGAIVSMSASNIDADTFLKLDMREIDSIFSQVFHLEKHLLRSTHEGQTVNVTTSIDSLPVEFERYVENLEEGELNKTKLRKMGTDYLTSIS
jgi:exonuclease SbcD